MIIFKLITVFVRLCLELAVLSGLLLASRAYLTEDDFNVGVAYEVAQSKVIKPTVQAACQWAE